MFVFSILSGFVSVARAETSVALWQGDKKGAVSMTFDDGFPSQYDNAFPLLQQRGFKATFFQFSGDGNLDESAVLSLVADGQEIGSNGFTNTSLVSLAPHLQQYQLETSQSDLQALTGQEVTTFAYPYGAYNAGVITNTEIYYIAARTEDTALNPSSPSLYELSVIAPNNGGNGDSNVISYLQDSVDLAVAENKWAIEEFHDVNTPSGDDNISSAALSAHMDYLVANEPNVWVAPMGTVAEYIYERDAASITTLFQDSSTIQLDLQCGLDSKFNTPLTLLTDYPLDWDYGEILVTQPGQPDQIATFISANSGYYIMYDAMPDAGTIELSVTPLEPIDFTVTASAGPNGSIDPNGTVTVVWNADQTLTAITDPNYLVDQWYVDGVAVQSGGSTYTLTNMRADHTVHVTFKPLTTVSLWQGNKKGAVSMTFDDGVITQFDNAFPLLQEYGLKGTFFIIVKHLFGDEDYMDEANIVDLAAAGQEIGSHTYAHDNLTKLEWWQLDAELSYSQSFLQNLTGQDVATLAYPYGKRDPNVIAVTDDYYISARTADSHAINAASPNVYTLEIVWPNAGGYGDPNVIPYLQGWVDDAVDKNKWAIEMFHAINDPGGYDNVSSEALSAHMGYLVENEPNVWVAPMGTVSEYIYERDAASIVTRISDSNMIRLDLHCGLDIIFDTPLTLLTVCPDGWENGVVFVTQGQADPEVAEVVSIDDTLYMVYNVIPDAGTVELSPVFEISGRILSPSGAPLPAVTVTTDNGGEGLTDPNGYFQLPVDNQSIGMVTPNKQEYTFDPSSYVDAVAGAELNYTGRHVADLFADGVIDGYDLEILADNWLTAVPTSSDIFDDGQINLKDFSILAEHWLDEYGNFSLITHSITASAGPNGSVAPAGDILADHHSDQLFTATADTGYQVDEWSVDGSVVQTGGTTYTLGNITAAHTVTVTLKPLTYIITSSSGVNGSIDPSGDIIKDHGSDQVFTAMADTGFVIDEWSVDGSVVQTDDIAYTLINITDDHTVTVTFTDTLTVDYTAGAGGSVTGETSQVVNYGADANTVTAVADTGYSFVDWSDGSTDNPRTDLAVTAAISVTANFVID